MKYLGLTLDGRWSFEEHFLRLVPRLTTVTNQCSRMLPNIGGPSGKARRLYATVVHSVALYGAPIWAEDATASKSIKTLLKRVQRRMAIRAIRGYRTVSHAGATLLAGFPPIELVARMQAAVFHNTRALRRERGCVELRPRDAQRIRTQARIRLMEEWRRWLLDPTINGGRIIEAIRPVMEDWIGRRWGNLSYRATQIITGHGCFGQYLCRIGRDPSAECQHCPSTVDTAQHTLAECEAWAEEREVLVRVVGNDLSLPAIIREILSNEEAWRAFLRFAENVMIRKESAERIRRGEAAPAAPRVAYGPHADRGRDRRRRRPRPCRQGAHLRA